MAKSLHIGAWLVILFADASWVNIEGLLIACLLSVLDMWRSMPPVACLSMIGFGTKHFRDYGRAMELKNVATKSCHLSRFKPVLMT
jgi:hypothetical protein